MITLTTKKVLLESDVYQSKKDLTTRFNRALATFCSKERQIFLEVKQQIILLVLKRVIVRAQQTFSTIKIAAPYARALYDFSIKNNIMHQITADFQNLDIFLSKTDELTNYLNNPLISLVAKREVLTKILKYQLNPETFKFLLVLVDRDRINLLQVIIDSYLKLVYQL